MSHSPLLPLGTFLLLSAFATGFAAGASESESRTSASTPAQAAQEDAAARKRRKLDELMVAMGQREITERTVERMPETFTKMGLPPEFGEKFVARFDVAHVVAFAVEVYDEHLEEETIDATIAFYASEQGKKLAAAMPDIVVGTMSKGEEYGRQIGEEVGREIGRGR